MRTTLDKVRDVAIGVWAVLALIYLFIPIFVIVLFSFNDNEGRFNFTWQGFTLKHWQDPFKIEQLQEAFVNSLTVAAVTTLIAVALGTFVALALVRYRWRGRGAVSGLVFLPLATPEVVLGAALLGWFLTLTFARGFATVIIAHVMFTLGYVVVTIRARLEGMDLHIEEAAMDLGASQMTTIRKVTFPLIMPGVVAAGLLAFAISIDDFVVTNFTAGPYQTFPLFVYGAAKQGVPPQVNVLATALLILALLGMFANLWYQRRAARRDAPVAASVPAVERAAMYVQISHGQCSLAPSATHAIFESLVQQPGSVTFEESSWDGEPATRVNVQSTEQASWGRTKVLCQAFYVMPLSWTDENGVEHPEGCAIKLPLGGDATSGGDQETLTALIDRFRERFSAESVYGVYGIDVQS